MFDSKKVKKLHRFKLYQRCKNNGKVCLYNKYSYYISQIILGRLYFNQDFVNNYKFLISDIIYSNDNFKGKLIQKEVHNEYVRFERCRNRIENMFIDSKNLFFLTFTISNKFYDNYYVNQDNFIRYIRDFLKDMNCIDFCFNLDFGTQNDRLHAHAIISHTISIL